VASPELVRKVYDSLVEIAGIVSRHGDVFTEYRELLKNTISVVGATSSDRVPVVRIDLDNDRAFKKLTVDPYLSA
jgi:hypothetical protein